MKYCKTIEKIYGWYNRYISISIVSKACLLYELFTLGSCKRIACHAASASYLPPALSFLLSSPCSHLFSMSLLCRSHLVFSAVSAGQHWHTPHDTVLPFSFHSPPPTRTTLWVSLGTSASDTWAVINVGSVWWICHFPLVFFVGGFHMPLPPLSPSLPLSLTLCWLIL